MTRKKKTRTVGSEGAAVYVEKKVSQLNNEGRIRQQQNKRKGVKAGTRYNVAQTNQGSSTAKIEQDPRLGSKKLISLVSEMTHAEMTLIQRQQAKKELSELENDPQFQSLLERTENGERLGAGLQNDLDQKLDRIEQLLKLLNIEY